MTYQFTENPVQGQIDVLPNGRKFQFNNGRWEIFTNTLPLNVAPVVTVVPPIVAADAPALPNPNPLWFNTTNGVLYIQDTAGSETVWVRCMPEVVIPGPTAVPPLESETPPALPNANPFWFKPSTSILHYQYNDGNSTQWVEI